MFKLLVAGGILVAVGLGLTIVGGVISGEGITMYHGYSDYEMVDPYITDATGIGTIDIDVESRRIVVEPATDDQITITYAESTRDTIEITNVGGEIKLTNDVDHWFWFMNFNMMTTIQERTVKVSIPATLAVDLTLQTLSGSMTVSDLPEVTSLDITGASGSITIDNLVGLDTLNAVTASGGISLENVTATDHINVLTVSGGLDFDEVSSPSIVGNSTSGGIEALDITADDVTLHCVSGSVKLEIHGELNDYYVKMSTISGSMYIDGSRVTQNAYGSSSLPDKLDLSTTSGSIRLNFLA